MTEEQKAKNSKRHREVVNKQYKIIRIKNDTDALLKTYKEKHDLSSFDNAIKRLLGV